LLQVHQVSFCTLKGIKSDKLLNSAKSGHRVPQVATSGTAMRTFVREPDRSPLSIVGRSADNMWCPVIAYENIYAGMAWHGEILVEDGELVN